ncbi:MAG: right-handed parallel beta-helix repeat-containing protein [bacterium]
MNKRVFIVALSITFFIALLITNGCQTAQTPTTPTTTTTTTLPVVIVENDSRSGEIFGPEIWRGTIEITGDVLLRSGANVTIEPGTTVKFAARSDDQGLGGTDPVQDSNFPNDPVVKFSELSTIITHGGTLTAIGTSTESITFTSNAASPDARDWHGLQYGEAGSTMNIQYAIIEYAYLGLGIGATATSSDITFKNNIVRHIIGAGVACASGSFDIAFTVADSDLSDCGHEAVDIHENASLIVENNNFHDNSGSYGDPSGGGTGVVIVGSDSIIRNNTFTNNNLAINVVDSSGNPSISGNTFTNNGQDIQTN